MYEQKNNSLPKPLHALISAAIKLKKPITVLPIGKLSTSTLKHLSSLSGISGIITLSTTVNTTNLVSEDIASIVCQIQNKYR